ncbi:MAG: hypothetical protein IRZ16_20230 [Myxococcaceae bacterium]|nr:hypothetical protein [Myxococcaceae bacterium]
MDTRTPHGFNRTELLRRMGRVRGALVSRHWHARILQVVIGLWLALSTVVWRHSPPQRVASIVGGLLIAATAILAGFFDRLRALVGLAGIWTVIATLTMPASVGTVVNTVYSVVVVLGLCMLPWSEERLVRQFGEERRLYG